MSSLIKHVDGYVEAGSGLLACVMVKRSGTSEHKVWFEYRASTLSAVTRLVWDLRQSIALFPADVTRNLFLKGYAVKPTEQQVAEYNGVDTAADETAAAAQAAAEQATFIAQQAAAEQAEKDRVDAEEAAVTAAVAQEKAAADEAALLKLLEDEDAAKLAADETAAKLAALEAAEAANKDLAPQGKKK